MLLHIGINSVMETKQYDIYLAIYMVQLKFLEILLYFFVKVKSEDAHRLNLPAESVHKTPSGEVFVKPELQKVCFLVKFCGSINFLIFLIYL